MIGNHQLEGVLAGLEKELVETRAAGEGLNRARKAAQEGARGEMEALEEGWRKGVGRVLEVEVAAEEVRREILDRMRRGAR